MNTGYLYVGDNSSISSTAAVKASYANEAGHADSANTASNATYATNAGRASTANSVAGYLYLNNGTSQENWNGRTFTTIYVPRTKGSSGQVWGMNGSGVAVLYQNGASACLPWSSVYSARWNDTVSSTTRII